MYSQVHVQVKHVLKQGFLTLRKQKREKVGGRLCWREGANGYEPVKVSGQGEKHVDSDDRCILANVHKEQSTGEGRRESEWAVVLDGGVAAIAITVFGKTVFVLLRICGRGYFGSWKGLFCVVIGKGSCTYYVITFGGPERPSPPPM